MEFGFQRVQPCPWFDSESEQAANFHTSTFPDSRIAAITPLHQYRTTFGQACGARC